MEVGGWGREERWASFVSVVSEETQHSREITRKMAGGKRENVRTFYAFRGFVRRRP